VNYRLQRRQHVSHSRVKEGGWWVKGGLLSFMPIQWTDHWNGRVRKSSLQSGFIFYVFPVLISYLHN